MSRAAILFAAAAAAATVACRSDPRPEGAATDGQTSDAGASVHDHGGAVAVYGPAPVPHEPDDCVRARQLRALGQSTEAQKWAQACAAHGGDAN
jgi:hypothetical protein